MRVVGWSAEECVMTEPEPLSRHAVDWVRNVFDQPNLSSLQFYFVVFGGNDYAAALVVVCASGVLPVRIMATARQGDADSRCGPTPTSPGLSNNNSNTYNKSLMCPATTPPTQ
jgi:hypothetical protein